MDTMDFVGIMEELNSFVGARDVPIVHDLRRVTRSTTKQSARSVRSGEECGAVGSSHLGDSPPRGAATSLGGADAVGGKIMKKIPKFHGSFSTDHVEEVISTFDNSKLSILERIGLGGLRHLKAKMHHSRNLVFWLQERIDVAAMCVRLDKDHSIQLTDASVDIILGVRSEGAKVEVGDKFRAPSLRRRLHHMFMTPDETTLPTVADANKLLLANYGEVMSSNEEEAFAVALAALVCAYMFGNMNRAANIPNDIWGFISEFSNLTKCRWSGYILSVIMKSANRVQRNLCVTKQGNKGPFSINVGGCWLYLELLYFDFIGFAERNIPWSWVPRVRVYEKSHIKDFISVAEISRKPCVFLSNKRRLPCVRDALDEDAASMKQGGVHTEPQPMETSVQEMKNSIDESFASMMDSLTKASGLAHKENLRHFESQRSHINNIFGDLRVGLQNEKIRIHNLLNRYGVAQEEHSNRPIVHGDTVQNCSESPHTSVDMDVEANEQAGFAVGESTSGVDNEIRDTFGTSTCGVARAEGGNIGTDMAEGNPRQEGIPGVGIDEVVRTESVQEGRAAASGIQVAEESCKGDGGICEPQTQKVADARSASMSPIAAMRYTTLGDKTPGVQYPLYDQTPGGGSTIQGDGPNATRLFLGTDVRNDQDQSYPVSLLHLQVGDIFAKPSTCESFHVPVKGKPRSSGSVLDCPIFDATPAEQTAIMNVTPSHEVHGTKRKRVKKSAVKSRNDGTNNRGSVRKVCSSRKPYKPTVGEVNRSTKEIAVFDDSKIDGTCTGAEKHIPFKRHVERRCADPSPFEMNMIHKVTDKEVADKHYKLVMADTDIHLLRDWIILSKPRRIRITGEVLQQEFKEGAAVSSEVFAAMVWVLQCQENKVYNNDDLCLNHWRHFLGPEFAEAVVGSDEFLITEAIREQFIGWHLGSKFEHCSLVLVPSNALGHWCLYLWDIRKRVIHVMDPVNGKLHPEEQRKLHNSNVTKLHAAVHMCKEALFTGWKDDFSNYNDIYQQYGYPLAKREADSAFYVIHYMRWFDGQMVRYNCDRRNVWRARKRMLHDLILVRGNTGYVPSYIAATINIDS
ncbi:unnamed protein product [Urochloa decumbens]|uniref:Ubiquitin-like protease family profile domain-containing protein n=1 Tax=Urochloa decumbens TaxID=240449 RepID=A0ABC8ZKD5_9POAL